ncbi:LuxR C-terminal-related transcriptional regulator [Paraburkholderia sp. DHOC27]|uniref:LuxR C-terminal-related transcriptional regulator n=1 Tax=Paraburkholderia sp. DHOC27 TaxID=2303330 RepID=UPI000E3C5480|nr:LuxR C-terminal-related transcriptional regulator [Paraburkholderia sp. DHOC27]RFU49373.1 cyclic nucleotide-binding protein [Paraburkholderia sp. DHOC27]
MLIIFVAPPGLFREGVARLLGELEAHTEVKCFDYGTDAPESETGADLLVIDGDQQGESLGAAGALRRVMPRLPVLALLTKIDQATIDAFIAVGVTGCFDKSEPASALTSALRVVQAGATYLPPALLTFTNTIGSPSAAHGASRPASGTGAGAGNNACVLTPRQIEVLALAARGESNKSIARQLNIAEGTVKVHLYTVYKALKVGSRGQASIAAARLEKVGDAQLHHALDAQLTIRRLLSHLSPSHFRRGDVLFHKDAPSDALYYIMRGTIGLQEIGVEVGAGTILGEIGLFSPDHRRTCTARCKSDCELLVVSATDAMRMYYQDPEFATYLIRLITRRLEADKSRTRM